MANKKDIEVSPNEEPIADVVELKVLHRVKNSLGRPLNVQWGESSKLLLEEEIWEIQENTENLDSLRKVLNHFKTINYVDFI